MLNPVNIMNINKALKQSKKDLYYSDFNFQNRKYTDDELLEYFFKLFDNKLNGSEKVNDTLIDKIIHSILLVVNHCAVKELPLSEKLLEKTSSLKPLYENYVKRFELEKSEEILDTLEELNKCVIGIYVFNKDNIVYEDTSSKQDIEDDKESLEVKQDIIDRLKKVQELEKKLESLEKDKEKREKVLNELKKERDILKKEIRELKKVNEKIGDENEQLKSSLLEKNSSIDEQNNKIDTLTRELDLKNNNIKSLETIVHDQKEELSNKEKTISVYQEQDLLKEKYKILESKILDLIIDNKYSVEEITSILNRKGFNTNIREVHEVLMKLSQKIKISSNNNAIPRTYYVESAICETDGIFELKSYDQVLDILLLADIHFDTNKRVTYSRLDSGTEYCVKNGIKYVFILGDIFACSCNYSSRANDIRYFQKNIDLFLDKYPYDNNICNAILGGNHDKRTLDYGIDLINLISSERDDFTPLGYSHATIKINNGTIMIHHPGKVLEKSFKETVPEELNSYYKNKSRSKVYIDLLGHYHRSYLSLSDSYFLVPSLTCNTDSEDGATHLKIYFDSQGKIESMSFIPLIFNDKLISAGEMEYKKLSLRK